MRFRRRAAPISSCVSRSCQPRPLCETSSLLDLGAQVRDRCGEHTVLRVLGGDLLAKRSHQAPLQAEDLLLRFVGVVLVGLHLDTQRRGAQRRLAIQPGDALRLHLRVGVRELPGEVVAHERAVNPRAALADRRFELVIAARFRAAGGPAI